MSLLYQILSFFTVYVYRLLGRGGERTLNLGRVNKFLSSPEFHTDSGPHPASCSVGTGVIFRG
jgi:hypothetical protein